MNPDDVPTNPGVKRRPLPERLRLLALLALARQDQLDLELAAKLLEIQSETYAGFEVQICHWRVKVKELEELILKMNNDYRLVDLSEVRKHNAEYWVDAANRLPRGFWAWVCGYSALRRIYLATAKAWLESEVVS